MGWRQLDNPIKPIAHEMAAYCGLKMKDYGGLNGFLRPMPSGAGVNAPHCVNAG